MMLKKIAIRGTGKRRQMKTGYDMLDEFVPGTLTTREPKPRTPKKAISCGKKRTLMDA